MSRMHSTKKGKSKSTRPYRTTIPKWVDIPQEELEGLIVELAKKGETASKIGVILRDQYGIPSAKLIMKKRITRILEDKGIKKELPEDLMKLLKKAVDVARHYEANKHDMTAKRGMQLVESKINRLAKYYIREGKIPAGWKYDLAAAKLLVE